MQFKCVIDDLKRGDKEFIKEEKKYHNFQKHILNELKEKEEEIQKLENKISNLINEYYNLKKREKCSKLNEINNLNSINSSHSKEYPNYGVFITINPGYLGYSELSEDINALFRPITVNVPDFDMIKKFVVLYALCQDLLRKQMYYD